MERFDYTFQRKSQPLFDEVPACYRHHLMGVDYVRLQGLQGGELFVTRQGWSGIASVLPEVWFVGEKFCKIGRELAGATGSVYRVPVPHRAGYPAALVVKFSRAAQDVPVAVLDDGLQLDQQERQVVAGAQFLAPFAEFGVVHRLRSAAGSSVRMKQPLAIYSPPMRYQKWELGRKVYLTSQMNRELSDSQEGVPEECKVTYDWGRLYILLYRWIDGIDAEEAVRRGMIGQDTMKALGRQARATLRRHGWMVSDHKPRHVIVRPRPDGSLLRRNGDIVWALIDYELLTPVSPV